MTDNSQMKGRILTVPQAGIVLARLMPDQVLARPYGIDALRLHPKFGAGVFLSGKLKADSLERLVVAGYPDDYFGDLGNDQSIEMLLAPFEGERSKIKAVLVVKGINVDFGYDLLMKFRRSGIEIGRHEAVLHEGPMGLDLTSGQFFEKDVVDCYQSARIPSVLVRQAIAFAKGHERCTVHGKMNPLRLFMDLS